MRYRRLGSSDLEVSEVSEVSLGSWLTFAGGVGLEQTRACTDAAFEAGSNFFDTANAYGRGAAESAWGQILAGRPRDAYVLATKGWGQVSEDPADRGLSATQVGRQVDARWRACGPTTSIRTRRTALTRTSRSRRRSRRSGRWSPPARHGTWASANGRPSRSGRRSTSPGRSCSPPPSPSPRCCGGRPRPSCSRCVRPTASPRSSGRRWRRVLTGKYRPGQAPPPDSRAASSDMNVAMDRLLDDAVLEAVDRLRPIAEQAGLSMAELAPPRGGVGDRRASRPGQVHANARASGLQLTPDTLAAIEEALGDTPVKQPTLAPLAQPGVTHRRTGEL